MKKTIQQRMRMVSRSQESKIIMLFIMGPNIYNKLIYQVPRRLVVVSHITGQNI